MIQGFGIDLTEIARVKRAVEKTPSFVKRILTPPELEQLAKLGGQRRYEYIAGRWSLKEAFAKAWGTGIGREVGFKTLRSSIIKAVGQSWLNRHLKVKCGHRSVIRKI